MECPSCGAKAPPAMNWCEACGADLDAAPAEPCVACGERDISEDGYCMSCGHKQPEERDHMVFEAGPSVAVTDRGRRHRHNEDAAAIGELPGGGAVLVVCDGVSSTPGSAEASMAAATAARDLLVDSLASGDARPPANPDGPAPVPPVASATEAAIADEVALAELGPLEAADGRGAGATVVGRAAAKGGGDRAAVTENDGNADAEHGEGEATDIGESDDPVIDALVAATAAAQAEAAGAPEVVSNAPHAQGGPPSSTFVAAVARPLGEQVELSVVWLGDSRAYWVGADGAVQLTGDHEEDGSLTRWLGADSYDSKPDVTRYLANGAGRLLLCSDGLWRYADPAPELAELVGRLESEHTTSRALAQALVGHANDSGGHDNITVALWSSDGDSSEGKEIVDE